MLVAVVAAEVDVGVDAVRAWRPDRSRCGVPPRRPPARTTGRRRCAAGRASRRARCPTGRWFRCDRSRSPRPTAVPRDITTPNGVLFQKRAAACAVGIAGVQVELERLVADVAHQAAAAVDEVADHVELTSVFGVPGAEADAVVRPRQPCVGADLEEAADDQACRASRRDRSPSGRPTSPPTASRPAAPR